ncbi:uncharacterized protein LOC126836523 [Adelges cooleyi]|uniref:uncharacterized protein LOC126836523 n=1 Tax=Adelges cooleyi TaxID=133065 RepID=UPI00218044B2|nr:uncharacterized protein LOC126836523 [Adelges cooleyi]
MDKLRKFRMTAESRQSKQMDANSNCVVKSKKKKLNLTKELIGGMAHFKKIMTTGLQKKNKKISFLDPTNGEKMKVDCEDTRMTKRLWHVSLKTLEELITRERRHRQEYAVNLVRHLDRLRELDRAKGEYAEQLKQSLADEDKAIEALRTDIRAANEEFDNRRRWFYRFYLETFGRSSLLDAAKAFEAACEEAAAAAEASSTAVVCETDAETAAAAAAVSDMANSLRRRIRSLAVDASTKLTRDACPSRTEIVQTAARRLSVVPTVAAPIQPRDGDKNFLAVWYAAVSAHQSNRTLESTVDALDHQTDVLRDRLSDVTARHAELSANKYGRQTEAVVLDDFYAVTEEINAQQMRSLEFSRIFAVDNDQLAEDMDKIQQLKDKIAEKKKTKEKLLEQTGGLKCQLDEYKGQYEELLTRKNRLTEDLINVQKSPSKLLDQSELSHFQALNQHRALHLKELKKQYNKLTNKRDALKTKLYKYNQTVKNTPNRTNPKP